jgi:hypothetical protein
LFFKGDSEGDFLLRAGVGVMGLIIPDAAERRSQYRFELWRHDIPINGYFREYAEASWDANARGKVLFPSSFN